MKFDSTKWKKVLAKAKQIEDSAMKKAVGEVTADLLREAQLRTPQDTGLLTGSGTIKILKIMKKWTGIVIFTIKYAAPMHNMRYLLRDKSLDKQMKNPSVKVGREYLKRPLEQFRQKYMQWIAKRVNEELRKKGS